MQFNKATARRRFLLQADNGHVLNLPVFMGDAQHTSQARQRAIDYSIASVLCPAFFHELTRRVHRHGHDRRTRIIVAVIEEVIKLLQLGHALVAVRARRQRTVPAFEIRRQQSAPQIGSLYFKMSLTADTTRDARYNVCDASASFASKTSGCRNSQSAGVKWSNSVSSGGSTRKYASAFFNKRAVVASA